MTGVGPGTFVPAIQARFIIGSDFTLVNGFTSIGLVIPYISGQALTARYTLFFNIAAGTGGVLFALNTLPTGVTGNLGLSGPGTSRTTFVTDDITALTVGTSNATMRFANLGTVLIDVSVANGTANGFIDLMATSAATGVISGPSFVTVSYGNTVVTSGSGP